MTDRFTDLSIDLETLGTVPGSVITQIGVAAFNADGHGPVFMDTFFVDPQSCIDLGMTVQWSTIKWWLQQSDAARSMFALAMGRKLEDALHQVNDFIRNFMQDGFTVWGYGATFDIALLECAYRAAKFAAPPWSYRQVACARTLCGAMQVERPKSAREHVGGEDAAAQAMLVQRCVAAGARP